MRALIALCLFTAVLTAQTTTPIGVGATGSVPITFEDGTTTTVGFVLMGVEASTWGDTNQWLDGSFVGVVFINGSLYRLQDEGEPFMPNWFTNARVYHFTFVDHGVIYDIYITRCPYGQTGTGGQSCNAVLVIASTPEGGGSTIVY